MLDTFFEEGYWFAPKRYGFGAGLPIAWQGWVVLGTYVALVSGFAVLGESNHRLGLTVALPGIVLATVVLILIAHKRTRGGWRWRWGEDA
jgi:hypothetical protein